MSSPFIEAVVALTVAGLIASAVVALPRPKPTPEQPDVSPVEIVTTAPVIRAEPLPDKTDAQRADDLSKEVETLNVQQRSLIEQVKALTDEVKKK